MGQIRYPQPARPSTIILELWKYLSDPSALAKGSRFHRPDGLARARTTPTKGKSTCTQQIRLLRHDIGGCIDARLGERPDHSAIPPRRPRGAAHNQATLRRLQQLLVG